MREIDTIVEYEGLTIQEAKLSYAERQKLPKTAFCGPDRSYPAYDAAHVRNGFARLATFGKKLPREVAKKIYRCLVKRAKKYKIEHDPSKFKWLLGKKTVKETVEEMDKEDEKLLEFLDEELKKRRK